MTGLMELAHRWKTSGCADSAATSIPMGEQAARRKQLGFRRNRLFRVAQVLAPITVLAVWAAWFMGIIDPAPDPPRAVETRDATIVRDHCHEGYPPLGFCRSPGSTPLILPSRLSPQWQHRGNTAVTPRLSPLVGIMNPGLFAIGAAVAYQHDIQSPRRPLRFWRSSDYAKAQIDGILNEYFGAKRIKMPFELRKG